MAHTRGFTLQTATVKLLRETIKNLTKCGDTYQYLVLFGLPAFLCLVLPAGYLYPVINHAMGQPWLGVSGLGIL